MSTLSNVEDTLIAGAGPIGLACAISAKRRGIDPLVIDAGGIVNAIYRYPRGMVFFSTAELLEIGGHPFVCAGGKPTREEALKYYRGVVRAESLRVATYVRLVTATRTPDGLTCRLDVDGASHDVACRRLVLATGYFDHPNRLKVPGEDLPHVSHTYDEAHPHVGRDVVVVGGKSSAIEAALDLFRAGARVTLVYRRAAFRDTIKYWLRPDIVNRIEAGDITAFLGANVEAIHPSGVSIRDASGVRRTLSANRVYLLTGFHPDFNLFRSIGIRLDDTDRPVLNPDTLETSVPGVHMVGSITRGRAVAEVFVENGRFDGERVFGGTTAD